MRSTSIQTKKMVLSALSLAIGMVLPFFTGQIPGIGNMLLPMHIPVMLCGFVCGWKYGLVVGGVLPILRSFLFGIPVFFPNAIGMAVELAVYGVCTGVFGRRFGRKTKGIYMALVLAMLLGRVAWGITSSILFALAGSGFTWKLFFAQGFVNAAPGIAIQLLLIPAIVKRIPGELFLNIKSSCMMRFEPAVAALRKVLAETDKSCILVAVDGKCASGKSTLGYYLKNEFDANLFHMDDFFLQKHQRTAERQTEIGGNVDYERFQAEVLAPLQEGKPIEYRIFDCGRLEITESKTIAPKRINIIEGSYSQHPFFGEPYDLKIFTEIDHESQLENIRKRDGEEKLATFRERWIPKEEAYFEKFKIKEKSDVVIGWMGKKK